MELQCHHVKRPVKFVSWRSGLPQNLSVDIIAAHAFICRFDKCLCMHMCACSTFPRSPPLHKGSLEKKNLWENLFHFFFTPSQLSSHTLAHAGRKQIERQVMIDRLILYNNGQFTYEYYMVCLLWLYMGEKMFQCSTTEKENGLNVGR